uniref:Uncharacterized protein n=1 Tax=Arundo donax TaxID=35708 RepID=A0A0A9AZ69_ARUDO
MLGLHACFIDMIKYFPCIYLFAEVGKSIDNSTGLRKMRSQFC